MQKSITEERKPGDTTGLKRGSAEYYRVYRQRREVKKKLKDRAHKQEVTDWRSAYFKTAKGREKKSLYGKRYYKKHREDILERRVLAKELKEIEKKFLSTNPLERQEAAITTGVLKLKKAAKLLTNRLDEKTDFVLVEIIWALGKIRDPKSIQDLKALSDDDYRDEIRKAVKKAIGRIEGQDRDEDS